MKKWKRFLGVALFSLAVVASFAMTTVTAPATEPTRPIEQKLAPPQVILPAEATSIFLKWQQGDLESQVRFIDAAKQHVVNIRKLKTLVDSKNAEERESARYLMDQYQLMAGFMSMKEYETELLPLLIYNLKGGGPPEPTQLQASLLQASKGDTDLLVREILNRLSAQRKQCADELATVTKKLTGRTGS